MNDNKIVYVLTMHTERGGKLAVWAFDSESKALAQRDSFPSLATDSHYFLIDQLEVM
jgi:hypothetical protein